MEDHKADMFKVLSVASRIKIIDLLKQRGAMGANELAGALGITPSAVSQHLKVLRYAGLVRNERKGYWLPYEVDPAALACCHDLLQTYEPAVAKTPDMCVRRSWRRPRTSSSC